MVNSSKNLFLNKKWPGFGPCTIESQHFACALYFSISLEHCLQNISQALNFSMLKKKLLLFTNISVLCVFCLLAIEKTIYPNNQQSMDSSCNYLSTISSLLLLLVLPCLSFTITMTQIKYFYNLHPLFSLIHDPISNQIDICNLRILLWYLLF